MARVAGVEQSGLIDVEPGAEAVARPKRTIDKTFGSYDQDQAMLLAPDVRDWIPVGDRGPLGG